MSQWIKLNVGGSIFSTTTNTICSIPDTMLYKLCDPSSKFTLQKDENDCILIDRDPKYFRVILNYLRTGKLVMDKNINPNGVLEEAKFYQITCLEEEIENYLDSSQITPRDFIFHKEALRNNKLKGVKLPNINLSGFILCEFDFERANLSDSDFSHCKLRSCVFAKAIAINVNFSDCILDKSEFQHALLTDSSFKKSSLAHCLLQRAQLQNVDFSFCNLKNAKFQGADLRGARFHGSYVKTAYFTQADLRKVEGLNWNDAIYIRGAIITQEQYNHLPEIIGKANKADLRFTITGENTQLNYSNIFQVRGTVDVEGTHLGVIVYENPQEANQIGLLFEGTKVEEIKDTEMQKHRGIWYRKVKPLSENEQEEKLRENENRVEGWVAGIYLMRVSSFI